MRRKQYKASIKAPGKRVWDILWGKETYGQWTAAFAEGSKAETSWEEGADILFLNGNNEGMISKIKEKKENEKMVFEHRGMVDKAGNIDTDSEQVKQWQGAEEVYLLSEKNGMTELTVEMDVGEKEESYFDTTWANVFRDLKDLAEK